MPLSPLNFTLNGKPYTFGLSIGQDSAGYTRIEFGVLGQTGKGVILTPALKTHDDPRRVIDEFRRALDRIEQGLSPETEAPLTKISHERVAPKRVP